MFAVTITASVQLVGVFLVFASLIVPTLVARAARRHRLAYGYGVGLAGYLLGLLASALWDLPTCAAIVCSLSIVAATVAVSSTALRGSASALSLPDYVYKNRQFERRTR